jgi:hypothetical protein
LYNPSPGQPGFDASHPAYRLTSDVESAPEPSSLLLLGGGLACLIGYCRRRHPYIHHV